MRKTLILSALTITLLNMNVQAQVKILNRFIQQTNTYKSLSYTAITNNTSPLGDSADTVQAYIVTNSVQRLQFEFKTNHDQDIFDGTKLLHLDLTNKFFS
jgi:hypothetical protein